MIKGKYSELIGYLERQLTKLNNSFKGKLTIENLNSFRRKGRISDTILNNFISYYNVAVTIFSEERVDIGIKFDHDIRTYNEDIFDEEEDMTSVTEMLEFNKFIITNLYLLIHFPELTVTNTLGHSTQVKDLFIKITFKLYPNSNKLLLRSDNYLQGIRTTFNISEISSDYAHSHLPGIIDKFEHFCLGSGDLVKIQMLFNNDPSPILFDLFLRQTILFLEWESMEGVPYRYLDRISLRDYASINKEHPSESYKIDALYKLKNYIEKFPEVIDLDWHQTDSGYHLLDNNKLDDLLYLALKNTIGFVKYYKDEKGNFYQTVDRLNQSFIIETKLKINTILVIFKGVVIEPRIELEEMVTIRDKPKYIHPEIKNYVISKLQSAAQKIAIRENITELLS